jgi:hypothetical protein
MATVVSPVSLFSRADLGYIGSGILMGSALFMSSDPVARLVERNSFGPQNPALLPTPVAGWVLFSPWKARQPSASADVAGLYVTGRHETWTKVSKIAQTRFQLPRTLGLP